MWLKYLMRQDRVGTGEHKTIYQFIDLYVFSRVVGRLRNSGHHCSRLFVYI
jgi:hypothetical protein